MIHDEPLAHWPLQFRASPERGRRGGRQRLSGLRRRRLRMLALWRDELTDTTSADAPLSDGSRLLAPLPSPIDPRAGRAAPYDPRAEEPADADLARAVQLGDEAARAEFVERLRCVPRFLANLNLQYGSLLQEEDLADLVQQTLLVVLAKLPTFRGPGSLRAWAYGIAHREYLHARRSRLRHASRQRPLGEDLDPPQPAEEVAADEYHAVWALDQLDPDERVFLSLRLFDSLEYAEIGRRFDMPENTAKTRFHRALQRLRELIAISKRREEHGA